MTPHRIPLWGVNAWLIEHDGRWIVFDTGKRRTARRFFEGINAAGCDARGVDLIVISHAHYDHVGCAAALKSLSGAAVAVHRHDADVLRFGGFILSDGLNWLGRYNAFMGRHIMPRGMFAFEPVEPDILVGEELRLDCMGFPAALIHTPGHSEGSISLLFDDGALFAGDLTITQALPGAWRHTPIYGSSVGDIKKTWRALIRRGAKHVYPGHGRDFSAFELEALL